MSLLEIVNNAQAEIGIPQTGSVVSNPDQQVITLLALANREGKDLADRYNWSILTKQAEFQTISGEDQGVFSTVTGATDDAFILNNTMWNRDMNYPIIGAISPQKWQNLKSNNVVGPYYQYRIRGTHLFFIPAATADQTVAFEYVSNQWCQSAALVPQTQWVADTDTGILDENLMTLGLIWRFLRSKGLAYAEQMADYEKMVSDSMIRDGGRPWLNLTGRYRRLAGPWCQDGSWNL